MKNLYYRVLNALTLPKGDDGYSTETVIVTALLVGVATAVGAGLLTFVNAELATLGGE
ncbi:hypothetical protein ABZ249_19860 [Nocardiopsis sp. NPDC006139]|uniref:hypothetical protein n=1 Tax=Nocardiopsis TaxID=2013 RepID=UPI0033AE86EF